MHVTDPHPTGLGAPTTGPLSSRDFAALDGAGYLPGDPGYATAAAAWNLAVTHRPAAVVVAAHVGDVVHTVRTARRVGKRLVVQTTGHGVVVPADQDSILLVLAGLDHVAVDPARRSATLGGGVQWGPVLAAAQEHGLAPLLGSAPHVGAVGYTLGGGFGWLARKHGLSVDRVTSLRVVLPDGWVVTASRETHPELFWALRGAGAGTLGVVVEMEVRLARVDRVYGGNLLYPLDAAREVFDRYREWIVDAPRELTSAFNITAFPPLDVVPEPLRGQAFAIVRGCHCGPLAEGAAWVDRLRRWRQPAMDLFGPMRFAESAQISQDPVDPVPAISSGRWLAGLGDDVVEAMLETVVGGQAPSPMLFAEARHAGGAVAVPDPTASFASREARHSLEVVGLLGDPAAGLEAERRIGALWERTAPHLAPLPGYLNFTDGQERREVAEQCFDRRTWERLVAVKREVDPDGVFAHGIDLA